MKRWCQASWPWLAAILSGTMLGFAFPRWDQATLVWLWQIPLFLALWFSEPRRRKKDGSALPRWRHGLALGYVAGLAFFLINLSWLFELHRVVGSIWAGIVARTFLPAYLAIFFALWGAFVATIARWDPRISESREKEIAERKRREEKAAKRRGLMPPTSGFGFFGGDLFGPSMAVLKAAFLAGASWCGLEWLRGILFTGFGWNGLGVALHESLYLIQVADLVGVTGLSFVIVFCNAIWTATLVRIGREMAVRQRIRPHLDFAAAMALIILVFFYGMTRFANHPKASEENSVHLRTLLVQLNVPMDQKWDREFAMGIITDYQNLTRGYVESSDFDLVIWPETALPGRWTSPWVQDYLNNGILKDEDFSLILGIEDEIFDENSEKIFNCLALATGSTDSAQFYRKMHRVPFGEYLPFRESFPPMDWIGGQIIPVDFSAGKSTDPLILQRPGKDPVGIVPLICFEDTLGRLARKFVRPGPQLIVNVTNDGWFYESAAPLQHLANAKFRCIELRRPMARAANTGVSAFIDENGSLEFPDSRGSRGHERLRVVQDPLTGNTFTTGTLPATLAIPKNAPITFYARFGDLFSVGMGAIALAMAALPLLRSIRKKA